MLKKNHYNWEKAEGKITLIKQKNKSNLHVDAQTNSTSLILILGAFLNKLYKNNYLTEAQIKLLAELAIDKNVIQEVQAYESE